MTNVIAWIDVETTGVELDANLLEIACIVTDTDLNILDEDGYEETVFYTPEQIEKMKNEVTPYVLDMHTQTNLWERLATGQRKEVIDGELVEYIARFAPEARLAGNSVRLDLNMVQLHLPGLSGHLHYRVIDVTTLATLAQWKGVPVFRKAKTHRAMDDIRESVAELQYLMSKMTFHA